MPISLRDLAERRTSITFAYQGEEIHVAYRAEALTKEFRAESLRLMREGKRIARRTEELTTRISTVTAPDGSPEAEEEDRAAEAAITQIQADDEALKRQLDALLCKLVVEWDVLQDDGKMLPLTPKTLFPIPADFEQSIISAIITETQQGEANGRKSTNP